MKQRNQGFVMPIVLVFMVISQLVYTGILHITQMETRHIMLLQEHYQRNIQTHFVSEVIDLHFEDHYPLISQDMFAEVDSFKNQLLYGLTSTESLLPENPQYGAYYLEGETPEQDLIYVYVISIISQENSIYEKAIDFPEISFVDEKAYFNNQFDDKLLSNTDAVLIDLFEQLTQLDWEEVYYLETGKILNWHIPSPAVAKISFNTGFVDVKTQQGNIILESFLNENDQSYMSNIPLVSINYRLHGQLWTFAPILIEDSIF